MKMTTSRLDLRPIRLSDATFVHDMAARPGVAVPAGYPTPSSLRDSRARVARFVAAWRKKTPTHMTFSILRRSDGAWLGLANLRWPHGGVGELGYSLHPDHWGQGYASEAVKFLVRLAFDEFGAHRVQATCWVKNPRSAGVLRNAGLKKEGTLKGYLKRGRVVRDEFMFGLARKDR
ncbi:MAG: GNAT family N-acetyltransferase [Elusimicrobia bacterium]|nr:GNAT family N-acetyltransferase [Elusimicrobiota bacterium]